MLGKIMNSARQAPRNRWIRVLRDFGFITLASAVYAAAWTVFILPYGIVSGGVAGLSNLVYYATGIPVASTYFGVNILLYAVALKWLGWRFLTKTIWTTVALSLFLMIGQQALTDPETGELIRILEDERFMSMLLGCTICGLSVAALFASSGSSGGTDIIAAIANKYFGVQIGTALIVIDLFIIGSGLFIDSFGPAIERVRFVAFGLCAMTLECATISYALNIRRRSVQFLIFTRRHAEVAQRLSDATGHTMTLLDARGWYTGAEMKVVCILARMDESAEIFRTIKEVDPTAFVSQSSVIGVWGEGFAKIS